MNIIDYFLLAGLLAASIYTIYRLFLGWRGGSEGRRSSNEWVALPREHRPTVAATKVDDRKEEII